MQIQLCFFGEIKSWLGRDAQHVELSQTMSIHDFMKTHPAVAGLKQWDGHILFALNHEQVDEDGMIRDGDELALMPPMTGG